MELERLSVRVLRARDLALACQELRVAWPLVILVDDSVRDAERKLLIDEALKIHAALLPLGPLVRREALGAWLRDAVQFVMQRRSYLGDDVELVAAEG